MTLLEANCLKLYVQDRLLLDVDKLLICKHDRIGLVGINGSGKTTLLEVLVGKRSTEAGIVVTKAKTALLPQLKRTNTTKSGGEVTQEYIISTINDDPEVLLADEPTTNLDTGHIEWLEKQLLRWQGALVIVSHDREFLDALCTIIWEIHEGRVTVYKGNYSDYARQKKLERDQHEMAYVKYVNKKKKLEKSLVLKERKAQRATKKPKQMSSSEAKITGAKPYFAKKQKKLHQSAKAIETRLNKLQRVEKTKEAAQIKMTVPNQEMMTGRIILRVSELSGIIGDRILWKNASFHVRGGEKLAIIGANGSGKTTLLKKIINGGACIKISPSINFGYFSQKIDILNVDQSILENVSSTAIQDETFIRTVLARLHFFRDDVFKSVRILSGGERIKVALAKLLVSEANTLILDEPTNYLDTNAVEALESLLENYEGTVIFVSHDRRLIKNIATRILTIKEMQIEVFEGTYGEYNRRKSQGLNNEENERLILETRITEVLSRLSIEPSPELETQFEKLLAEKRQLDKWSRSE